MNYPLFDDYITLQALLKDLRIIQSGGAVKSFLQDNQVLLNTERETRRGKKLRLGDVITIVNQNVTITLTQPSDEQIKQHQEDLDEKQRVAAIVKKLNKKVTPNATKVASKPQKKPRFPGT
ncbi:S4 domain-containing protein YaaA [Streptococcus sp. zg-JUN1979]|uniref:S4 domain-containing protein YaaA n=1 Tax=Streptococcus sp. zg-JUN1979 TaxID=3391450 RepID=UPI0039A525E6